MIKATNYAPTRFRGVLTCGLASWPTHTGGTTPAAIRDKCSRVVFGPLYGSVREVDLFVDLAPGESVEVDVEQLTADPYEMPAIADPATFGVPVLEAVLNGVVVHRMQIDPIGWEVAGAKMRIHCSARIDRLPFVDVWVDFVPGQGWANWEALITAASPAFPGTQWTSPTDLRLGWSVESALVVRAGLRPAVLMRAGETMAHGQARAFRGAVGWQPLDMPAQESAYAAGVCGVVAFDTAMPSPIGLPLPSLGKQFGPPIAWANRNLTRAIDALDGYGMTEVGWVPNSSVTGAQEDQGYAKGGECSEAGNVLVNYFVALGWARRPCHWITEGGKLHAPTIPEGLVFWDGRPHWHPQVSPNRLGLERLPTSLETSGWMGPDRQHWFANRLFFAAAATCSPLLQRLIEHQAQIVLFQETTDPGLSTSHADADRAVGWTSLVVANLLRLLKDNELRAAVKQRALDRVRLVLIPELDRPPSAPAIWDPMPNDPRSGVAATYPRWWTTWKQGVGAFGLYTLATMRELRDADPFTMERAKQIAIAAARAIVDVAWIQQPDGTWKGWEALAIRADGQQLEPAEYVEGVGVHGARDFRHAWTPLGIWVAAKEGHARARMIYDTLRAEAVNGRADLSWLPVLT